MIDWFLLERGTGLGNRGGGRGDLPSRCGSFLSHPLLPVHRLLSFLHHCPQAVQRTSSLPLPTERLPAKMRTEELRAAAAPWLEALGGAWLGCVHGEGPLGPDPEPSMCPDAASSAPLCSPGPKGHLPLLKASPTPTGWPRRRVTSTGCCAHEDMPLRVPPGPETRCSWVLTRGPALLPR